MTEALALSRDAADTSYLEDLAKDVERDGICVIRGLFPRGLIQQWASAFHATFDRRARQPGGVAVREKDRYYMTLPWVEPFADPSVFAHPTIMGVIRRVFRQPFDLVQLASDTPVDGSIYQDIHRDFNPLFGDANPTPLYAVAVNFPLVDVRADNGPFEMARGTHRLPRDVGLAKIAAQEIKMEPFYLDEGDVMIRSPLALHRGTPNVTPVPRPMVVMGYVMKWLHTPKVDLDVPRDLHQNLPGEAREMLRCHVVDQLAERQETYLQFKY